VIHYVEDSFALIERLRPQSFDHVITDPPFDAHTQSNMMSGTTLAKVDLKFAPVEGYAFARTLRDLAKRWTVVKCAVEAFTDIKREVGDKAYARSAIWYKPNSMGQITGDRPANACEGLAVFHSLTERKRWNCNGAFGFYKCNGTRGERDRHPNQMPLDLCLRLVASFTEIGESILDPWAGSGRIGEAALLLGREYVGFDFDREWVERGNARLARAAGAFASVKEEYAKALCSARKEEV
jgi:site-specific DNA-methyltransferase (adenine-specific)